MLLTWVLATFSEFWKTLIYWATYKSLKNLSFPEKNCLSFGQNLSFYRTWVLVQTHKKKAWINVIVAGINFIFGTRLLGQLLQCCPFLVYFQMCWMLLVTTYDFCKPILNSCCDPTLLLVPCFVTNCSLLKTDTESIHFASFLDLYYKRTIIYNSTVCRRYLWWNEASRLLKQ